MATRHYNLNRPPNGPAMGSPLPTVPENRVVTQWFGEPIASPSIWAHPTEWAQTHASLLIQVNGAILLYRHRRLIDKSVQKMFYPFSDAAPVLYHKNRTAFLASHAYGRFLPPEKDIADEFNAMKRACSAKTQYGLYGSLCPPPLYSRIESYVEVECQPKHIVFSKGDHVGIYFQIGY